MKNIVSVDWLAANLQQEDLVVLDATMKKMPDGTPIATPDLKIPGARAFNFDTAICEQTSELPHMLPTPEAFQRAVRELGISSDTRVVCYDAMGIFSSPRAWWMFKVMGHQSVYVLDGGLPRWIAAEKTTVAEYTDIKHKGDFVAKFDAAGVYSAQQVLGSLSDPDCQILDARSQKRFSGEEAEPRSGLRRGHIPGSNCLPFTDLLDSGVLKDIQQLKAAYADRVAAPKLVFSCGSGVTACVLALAADECGYQDYAVYDGSWAEWGLPGSRPVETICSSD